MELNKPLLANSGLKAIPALEELMLYSVTREWRFHFAESLPVPINGSNLEETQVMANPSGVCHDSRLCIPLPNLKCQLTFFASSMVSPCVLCLCLPSPPWAHWDPAPHEKLVTWYLIT
jgi:hypothetical protein